MKHPNLILRITALISFYVSILWFDRNNVFSDQFGVATSSFHVATMARFVIVAYVVFTMVAIGKLLLRRVGGAGIKGVDNFLAASVLGGSVIVVIVFVLGLSGLLYRWVLAVLLMGGVFCWPSLSPQHFRWPKQGLQAIAAGRWERYFTAILSVGLAAQIAYLLLWKGLVSPSIYGDIVSHYIPYYDSVVRQHGTANINEFYWHFYEFKGSSFHFLAAVLADVQAIQLLVFCLICIAAAALFKTVQRIGGSASLGLLAIAIFLGSTQMLDADLQKVHLSIGVFIILSFYFGHMLFEADDKDFRPLAWVFCVAIGTVSLLQTLSSAYAILLLVALAVTALCFRQYRLLPIFGIAMATVFAIAATTMLYNFFRTGMYEIYPIVFFMEHGDKTRYLQQFSLTDMAFLIDVQPNNPDHINGIVNSYKAGGVASVIRMLLGAPYSSIILMSAGAAATLVVVKKFFYKTEQVGGKLFLITVLAVALTIALALTNISPLHFFKNVMVLFPREMGYGMGLVSILIMSVILLFQPFGTRQAKAALVVGILFALGVGVIIIIAGSSTIERMTVFRPFFQALFFVAATTFLTHLLAQRRLGSLGVISATISLGLFFLPITNIKNYIYRIDWHPSLFVPYLKGQISYSEIYGNLGGKWAEYIRHHIPSGGVVVSLNYCLVCESLPNMRWLLPLWNIYSDKTGEVWYGSPDMAAKILKERHIDYIVVNLSQPLVLYAYAPLFRPESIGKFFKVYWASPDTSPHGKSYILTWRDETLDNNSSIVAFIKDYQDKVALDRNTGDGFHDYSQTSLYGHKRFGSQWIWDNPSVN